MLRSLGLACPAVAGATHLAHLEAPDEFLRLAEALPRRTEAR